MTASSAFLHPAPVGIFRMPAVAPVTNHAVEIAQSPSALHIIAVASAIFYIGGANAALYRAVSHYARGNNSNRDEALALRDRLSATGTEGDRAMRGPFRIEAYVIASADGMIADKTGLHPNSLKLEADQRFFEQGLDRAAVVVHGRNSHEGQPNSSRRRRLILTRKVAALAPDPDHANARFWNPAGASLEEACAAVGCSSGTVAVIGGPEVYSYFLKFGYDDFYLSRADKVRLPGGVPLFAQGRLGRSLEEVLQSAGLQAGRLQHLDDQVSLVEWTPPSGPGRGVT
jgi:dihydrofolate reductase